MSNTEIPDLILGTAGHIDHGKSSLILALTGTDPDRLAEEKRRGITIELGFAQLILPDGTTMGVVDVPGHERFVRQMIAGATGIDLALLVVAADDGIMPQTVEHIAVLQTLGVKRCVVALTKIDLVDDEWSAFMTDEIANYLADTPYADAPIIGVSSKTHSGLDELLVAIQRACQGLEHIRGGKGVRLPIDRVFTIKGAGTVVTGTLWSGTVHTDDEVEILPSRLTGRVRSVQRHGTTTEKADAGNRVALNLGGIRKDDVHPGDFIDTPGLIDPTDRFDAYLTYRDTANSGKPLKSGARMHIAHGTREVLGRVLLCDGIDQLAPQQSALVQIRLETPLPVSYADRFVIRRFSPVQVAGGGMVLQAHPRRRSTLIPDERILLESLHEGSLQTAVEAAARLQDEPFTISDLAHEIGIPGNDIARCVMRACQERSIMRIGGDKSSEHIEDTTALFTTPPTRQRLLGTLEKTLVAFHGAHPTEAGISKDGLRHLCFPRMGDACFDALIEHAIANKTLVSADGLIGHPSAQGATQKAQDDAARVILGLLKEAGLQTPSIAELADQTGLSITLVRKAMTSLERQGRVCRISSESFLDADTLETAKRQVAAFLESGSEGTVAGLRDTLKTTRKYAVPLLEYLDSNGFTKREGDQRILAH